MFEKTIIEKSYIEDLLSDEKVTISNVERLCMFNSEFIEKFGFDKNVLSNQVRYCKQLRDYYTKKAQSSDYDIDLINKSKKYACMYESVKRVYDSL